MQTSLQAYYPYSRRLTANLAYAIRDHIRSWKAHWLQTNLKTYREVAWPDHGYRILGKTEGVNGLSRAFRYEIDKLNVNGEINQTSRNVLIFGQPRSYRRILRKIPSGFQEMYRIGMWVCEFETFPPDWHFALDIVNEIWTPSEFSARALRQATWKPVKVVPHAVGVVDVAPMERAHFGIADDDFLGLAIMDIGTCPDRKNPLAHVEAWKKAFGHDQKCKLLIKARFSPKTKFARSALIDAIGRSPNIKFIEVNFTDVEMAAFQRMADVYLSLHRSEGYGLNIHEMLEIGTPVIATGYSGNMDFMARYTNAFSVPYRLVPYSDPTRHYRGKGLVWAEADTHVAARYLKAIHNSRAELRQDH